MVFIHRVVNVKGKEAEQNLEATINSHLVTEHTLRIGRVLGAGERFDAEFDKVPTKSSTDYRFDVIDKSSKQIDRVREGSWFMAMWKRDPRLIPKRFEIYNVELLVDTDPSLVNGIDQALITPPYNLVGGSTVTEALYSFSTKESKLALRDDKLEGIFEINYSEERRILRIPFEAFLQRAQGMVSDSGLEGDISLNEINSNDKSFRYNVSGSVKGEPRIVLNFRDELMAEMGGRMLGVSSSEVKYIKE